MKKIFAILLSLFILLTGCGIQQESIEPAKPEAETLPNAQEATPGKPEITPSELKTEDVLVPTELLAVSVPAVCDVWNAEDGTELFSYTSQHMQFIFPEEEVAEKVILDFLNRVDRGSADVASILNTAQQDYHPGDPWTPYFFQTLYSPTRIDRGVLSLFGTQHTYSGGSHGNMGCVAANYDLTTGDVLTLGSIMHMDAEKDTFIQIITDKLAAQKDEYNLYDDFADGVFARLNGDENLYEDFYFTPTGLCFFFSPYEIAPYSSGIITVEIPYNELPGLIYDGYFPAERQKIFGSLLTDRFTDLNMEQFNNMAELRLSNEEETIVLYPDGAVEDIRIVVSADGISRPKYTAFAASQMSGQDAVVLRLSKELMNLLSVSYFSGETTITMPLSE